LGYFLRVFFILSKNGQEKKGAKEKILHSMVLGRKAILESKDKIYLLSRDWRDKMIFNNKRE